MVRWVEIKNERGPGPGGWVKVAHCGDRRIGWVFPILNSFRCGMSVDRLARRYAVSRLAMEDIIRHAMRIEAEKKEREAK